MLLSLCLSVLILSFSKCFVFGADIVTFGEVDINLYVVALDGVSAHGVGNMTNTVNGVLQAASVDTVHWVMEYMPTGFGTFDLTLGEIHLNVSASVINDWEAYKEVVETSSNTIIVNAHGETIPVPTGYTREDWVDKIAEAMAYRNVTWVHTAGYPFYYYHYQESGENEWGEEGFKRFMWHIGKNDVTCWPSGSDTDPVYLNEDAEYTLMHGWFDVTQASMAERGRPLNASNFKDRCVAVIWGTKDDYMTGAITKFAKADQSNSFGFYVHVGTRKTFASGGGETDGDYYRGYLSAAQAIYTSSFRMISDYAISQAEKAIDKAESEGRTHGIGEARQLLQQATEKYNLSNYVLVLEISTNANNAANNATQPSFIEAYALPLIILGITGIVTATSLVVRWRKNSRKRVKKTTNFIFYAEGHYYRIKT